jgi:hypothetical protein
MGNPFGNAYEAFKTGFIGEKGMEIRASLADKNKLIDINLRVTVAEAKELIGGIPHEKCRDSLKKGYFAPNGVLDAASIYWLYCWAYNGQGSDDAKMAARNVWNEIFNVPYDELDEEEFHEIAKKRRYNKHS